MRIVGNLSWSSIPASSAEAIERGQRLDALARELVPDFQPKGLFWGPHSLFEQMDAEKEKRTQAWLHEHVRRTT